MWVFVIIGAILLLGLLLKNGSNAGTPGNNDSQTKELTVSDIRAYFPYMDSNLAIQYRDAILKGKYTFKVGKGLIEQWERNRMLKKTRISSAMTPSSELPKENVKLTWWQLKQYDPVMSIDESANYLAEYLLDESKLFTVKASLLKKWEKDLAIHKENDRKLSLTTDNNNKGIAYEKSGDIASAISIYEENLKIGYPATHSYERLMILYHKGKKYEDEIRVIKKAIKTFSSDTRYYKDIAKWQERLNKLIK